METCRIKKLDGIRRLGDDSKVETKKGELMTSSMTLFSCDEMFNPCRLGSGRYLETRENGIVLLQIE